MSKIILITGSSSGIGRAVAENLLLENHTVIGLARNHTKFQPETKNYVTYAIDFSDISSLEYQCRQIQKNHPQINTIICCAGYGQFCELEQFSVENMQNIMNVNFLSQAILIKTWLPTLKRNKCGHIILLGSECALEGKKMGSLYSASKFALRGFAQSLRKECVSAHIPVTLINPGVVDTPFFTELSFCPAPGAAYSIQAQQIASLINMVVKQEPNYVLEEINLQPLKKAIEKNR